MKLLFWLAKGRADRAGLAPVWARITLDSRSVEVSTQIKVKPADWDSHGHGLIRGKTDLVYLQNARLTDIRAQITEIYHDLLRRRQPVTAKLIKLRYTGEHKAAYSVLEMAQVLLANLESDPDYAPGTVRTYGTRIRALREFLESVGRKDLLCEEVETQTAKDFITYMRQKGSQTGHAQKCARALKKVVDQAVALKVVPGNPLSALRMKKPPAREIVFLTEEEFALLSGHRFRSARLGQVRDLFVLQCCTGLAYAELAALGAEHLYTGPDSRPWLRIERAKVPGGFCRVPLMEKAQALLKHYWAASRDYALPVIANGNYNAYLKEVAEVVGIEKNVTTHVARRTTGVLLLNRGVPIETISQILGHSSVRTTQEYYAQVLDAKIAEDMAGIEF